MHTVSPIDRARKKNELDLRTVDTKNPFGSDSVFCKSTLIKVLILPHIQLLTRPSRFPHKMEKSKEIIGFSIQYLISYPEKKHLSISMLWSHVRHCELIFFMVRLHSARFSFSGIIHRFFLQLQSTRLAKEVLAQILS